MAARPLALRLTLLACLCLVPLPTVTEMALTVKIMPSG
ncbi:hypothetical protein DFAR_1100009 [Desulfarculales bacterium]